MLSGTKYEDYVKLQISKPSNKHHSEKGGLEFECKQQIKIKPLWVKKVREIATKQVNNVLVLGGRWGSDVLFLKDGGFDCNIVAIDLFDPPLSELVSHGDAHDLSFAKVKFELVWAHHVFEHFYSPSEVIRQIESVTTSNAHLAIALPNFEKQDEYDAQTEFHSEAEFLMLFKESKFSLIHRSSRSKMRHKKMEVVDNYYIFERKT